MKILVVDDSEIDRKLIISSLQKAGVPSEFLEASDGREALEVLEKEYAQICLLFLDWQMPKIDGLEILKRVAQNPQTASMPVIMSTATTAPEDEEIARLLNPDLAGFLNKPFDPEKVVALALPHAK